jgi:hypothetical protein
MRIRLRERDVQARRWVDLLNEEVQPTSFRHLPAPLTLGESSHLALFLYPDPATLAARVRVGDVLVASTLEQDRPDFLLRQPPDVGDQAPDCFSCSGRLLRDWVGLTELTIEVQDGRGDVLWRPVLTIELRVTAGKMEQALFEAMCQEIADHSAAVLLDVYGKTSIGLGLERRPGDTAPLAALQRVRQALDEMAHILRQMAHQPAYRLKTYRVREPAVAEQGVSAVTLEEACLDPTLVVALPAGIRFREHVRETAASTFDLPENRLIAGFLRFLGRQLADLRTRIQREVDLRLERRAYRHRRTEEGGKTWWESEDLPRLEEFRRLLDQVGGMERDLANLRRYPFLPATPPLREVPPSTQLIRSHQAYGNAYKVIVAHFQAFRVQLDDQYLVARAKSLPVLYEWWCFLEVLRILQSCLRRCDTTHPERDLPLRRLVEERDRLVVEFAADQAVDFLDAAGRLVRLRYGPHYRPPRDSGGLSYGLLGSRRVASERTPDFAIEVFPALGELSELGEVGESADVDPTAQAPDLIIVLDAKYSSDTHQAKLDEVGSKYGKIGLFHNGRILSRQVWALTPAPADDPGPAKGTQPKWAVFCTVDNLGFWSEQYDMTSCVVGAVQAKPQMLVGRSPLELLLRLILKRAEVKLREWGSGESDAEQPSGSEGDSKRVKTPEKTGKTS